MIYRWILLIGVACSAAISTAPLVSAGTIVGFGSSPLLAAIPAGDDFTKVVTDGYGALALRKDGSIVGWGEGTENTPTGSGFVSISMQIGTAMFALQSDGRVHSFGQTLSHQAFDAPSGLRFTSLSVAAAGLYLTTETGDLYQRRFSIAPDPNGGDHLLEITEFTFTGLSGIASISNSECDVYFLRHDGSIASLDPVSTHPSGIGFRAVSGGCSTAVAIHSDGILVTWGDGDWSGFSSPPPGEGFRAVDAGMFWGVALDSAGQVRAWGLVSEAFTAGLPRDAGFVSVVSGRYSEFGFALSEPAAFVPKPGSMIGALVGFGLTIAATAIRRRSIPSSVEGEIGSK